MQRSRVRLPSAPLESKWLQCLSANAEETIGVSIVRQWSHRKGAFSIVLLLLVVGLNCWVWSTLHKSAPRTAAEHRHHSDSLPSDSCYIGPAASLGQPAGTKASASSAFLDRIGLSLYWRSVELKDVPRRVAHVQTLQSQRVLMQI